MSMVLVNKYLVFNSKQRVSFQHSKYMFQYLSFNLASRLRPKYLAVSLCGIVLPFNSIERQFNFLFLKLTLLNLFSCFLKRHRLVHEFMSFITSWRLAVVSSMVFLTAGTEVLLAEYYSSILFQQLCTLLAKSLFSLQVQFLSS